MCSHLLTLAFNHPVNAPLCFQQTWFAFFPFRHCSSESSISGSRSLPALMFSGFFQSLAQCMELGTH